MKRILLIMPYGGVGGMERLALSFYNHYKAKGHYIKALKFIKLKNDIINFGEDELFLSDKDYHEMPKIGRVLFNLKIPLQLRSLIKKHKLTHTIAFGDPANFYSSITFTKEFKIGSIHALKSVEMSNNSRLSKLTKFGLKNTFKNLDKLVCISKGIKEDLISKCEYTHTKNLEVIYNPHNVDLLIKKAKEPIEGEEKTLFDGDTILFLGRFSTQKSPWHLINAFSIVLKSKPDLKLIVIGDGDAAVLDCIKKLITAYNMEQNVFFLGRKANPYNYLAQTNALVLSSHYEGTPNVIVESIAVGTPIVSSNCTKGIGELMSNETILESNQNITVESGIITPNLFKGELGIPNENNIIKEEKLFANAILEVVNNPKYKTTLKSNRESLLKKFDLEIVSTQYLSKI